MVAAEAEANRAGSAALVRQDPDLLVKQVLDLTEGPTLFAPGRHRVLDADINPERLRNIVRHAHERFPADFATLLGAEGVGPATVRSLSLLAELIYDAPASHRDPADRKWPDYSYTHGGKDGVPFPVDRATYDRNIAMLLDAVRKARVGESDKRDALKRLAMFE